MVESARNPTMMLSTQWLMDFCSSLQSSLRQGTGTLERWYQTALTREQREYHWILSQLMQSTQTSLDDLATFLQLLGEVSPRPPAESISLRRTLQAIALDWRQSPTARGNDWTIDVRPEVVDRIRIDRDRLVRMITNIGLVIQERNSGKSLDLQVIRADDGSTPVRLAFSFRDPTPSSIADRWETLSLTPTTNSLSLRMPIAVRIAELMGARLIPNEDGWTVEVPVDAVDETGPPVDALLQQLSRWRILVIAEHPSTRQSVRDLIVEWGATPTVVDTATAGLSALWRAALLGRAYSLCLIDLRFPIRDSWRLIEQIKTDPELRVVPLVALGQLEDPAQNEKARQLGVSLVAKPFTNADLLLGIREALQMPIVLENTPPTTPPRSDGGIQVLFVQANQIDYLLMRHWLESDGHTLTAVESLTAALEEVARRSFDIIVLDLESPEVGGLLAVRFLHENGLAREVPLIGLIAQVEPGYREQAEQAGLQELLLRPLARLDFQRAVARLTRKPMIDPEIRREGWELVSVESILAATEGRESLYRKLIALFRQRYPDLLQRLRDAIQSGEPVAMEQALHALGGICATFSLPITLQLRDFPRDSSSEAALAYEKIERSLQRLEMVLTNASLDQVQKAVDNKGVPSSPRQ